MHMGLWKPVILVGKTRQTISAAEQQRLEDAGVYLHEDQRKGTWADSEVERLLRAILKYSRQTGSYSSQEVLIIIWFSFWRKIQVSTAL